MFLALSQAKLFVVESLSRGLYPDNGTNFNIMYKKGERIKCRTDPEMGFLFDHWAVDDKKVKIRQNLY